LVFDAVGGEFLYELIADRGIKVEGDGTDYFHFGLPAGGHVGLEGVVFVGDLEGGQAEAGLEGLGLFLGRGLLLHLFILILFTLKVSFNKLWMVLMIIGGGMD